MVEQLLETMPPAPWIILFSPLVATVAILLFAMRRPKLAANLSLAGILISLALSVFMFLFHIHNHFLPAEDSVSWIRIAGLTVDFGYYIDRLTLLMLLIVTGVGSCIFFYSIGYMHGDSSFPRYFASLSLFAFSMIGIVLSNNFLQLFVFWELVAVSSYLLIGFWFEKPSAADAGNKAFIVNRVADFGMVLGIFTVWMLSGLGGAERTFVFSKLSRFIPEALASGLLSKEMAVTAALLVFCGVVGKSAQFPLYIWLPDAMEGPTPVSALIHAATMVAAGVYLMARSFFLIAGVPEALTVIAHIGAVTALLAAVLALVQNDIKKILAYSTISQLGYMVLALGLGSSDAAMYHLTTHAFFKALLFLAAGAMIHHLHTQDIWDMGGLLKRMPVTSTTFLIGTLALCGIYPFSGFFSKDEILTLAYHHHAPLYVTALFTAGLTAFYMSRATWVAVLGPQKAKKHTHGHEEPGHAAHGAASEAPFVMKAPLVVLAVFSAAAGFIGIPRFLAGEHAHAMPLNLVVAGTSTVVALIGILAGTAFYANLRSKDDPLVRILGRTHQFVVQKYYLDDFFYRLADVFQKSLARILTWFDWNIVIGRGVNGTAWLTGKFGSLLRRSQTGHVQTYAMVFGFGIVAIIYLVMKA
jgi:NADH-quinone oxidoreductase subunit L